VEGFLLQLKFIYLSLSTTREKEKDKDMQFITEEMNKNYNVEQQTRADGTIKILLTPKHINCYGCKKEIEYVGSNLLVWTDKDNYKREARFCRSCKQELKQYGYFK
jgi:hypothetical protein